MYVKGEGGAADEHIYKYRPGVGTVTQRGHLGREVARLTHDLDELRFIQRLVTYQVRRNVHIKDDGWAGSSHTIGIEEDEDKLDKLRWEWAAQNGGGPGQIGWAYQCANQCNTQLFFNYLKIEQANN
jgi:hypothetical protein